MNIATTAASAASAASRDAYEAWHAALPVDDAADAPWHRLVRAHLDPARDLAGRRVLEIGCGRGGFACTLATVPERTRPTEIVAADFSAAALAKARGHAARLGLPARLVDWQEADIQNLRYADGSFDTVFSCETIEHVPNPRRAVRELARVLRPGGRLFLTAPNYLGVMGLYRGYLRLRGRRYQEEGQPINQFLVLARVRGWVAATGLHVEHTDGACHLLPFPGRPPIPLPALDRPALRSLLRWTAVHGLVVARKPSPSSGGRR